MQGETAPGTSSASALAIVKELTDRTLPSGLTAIRVATADWAPEAEQLQWLYATIEQLSPVPLGGRPDGPVRAEAGMQTACYIHAGFDGLDQHVLGKPWEIPDLLR